MIEKRKNFDEYRAKCRRCATATARTMTTMVIITRRKHLRNSIHGIKPDGSQENDEWNCTTELKEKQKPDTAESKEKKLKMKTETKTKNERTNEQNKSSCSILRVSIKTIVIHYSDR